MTDAEIRKALEDARKRAGELRRKIARGEEKVADLQRVNALLQTRIANTQKLIEQAQKDDKAERVQALKELLGFLKDDDQAVKDALVAKREQLPAWRKAADAVAARIKRLTQRLHAGGVPNVPTGAFGLDAAWSSPNVAGFKAAGVKFFCGYLSTDSSKNLTPSEAKALSDAGIPFIVVWETTASRALSGEAGGAADARAALAQQHAIDPKRRDAPIYFAVDWDATDAQKPTIANYLRGAASVLGKGQVGVYGSYYVCDYMLSHDVCGFAWQTYAWSGGHVLGKAHLLQYSNGHVVAGVSCDYNKSLQPDFGQSFA